MENNVTFSTQPTKVEKPFTFWQALGYLFKYSILSQLLVIPLYGLLYWIFKDSNQAMVITQPFAQLLLVYLFWRRFRFSWRAMLSDKGFSHKYMAQFALVLFALMIVVEPLEMAIKMPDWANFKDLANYKFGFFVAAVIVAPLVEEIVMRGVILKKLLESYSPMKAILFSASIFGIIHLNPAQLMGAFLIGIILGIAYYETRSLWYCIILHFLNNYIFTMLEYLFPQNISSIQSFYDLLGGGVVYYAVYGISLFLLIRFFYEKRYLLHTQKFDIVSN